MELARANPKDAILVNLGSMADSIAEMSDVILAMADNIGMAADGVVATRQVQGVNLASVQSSVPNAQEFVVALTVSRGL